jgi:hypothetical protein
MIYWMPGFFVLGVLIWLWLCIIADKIGRLCEAVERMVEALEEQE